MHDSQSSGKFLTINKEPEEGREKGPAFKMPRTLHEESLETVRETVTRTTSVRPAEGVENADVLAPKKSRKKKDKDGGEAQTVIKKTKITKVGAMRASKKAFGPTKKAKEVLSEPSNLPASTQEEDLNAKEEFRELCLEKAITRKKEWTPCKDTAPDPTLSEDAEKSMAPKLPMGIPIANEPLIARFGSHLGEFSFSEKDESSSLVREATRQSNGEAMMKKRRIELVNGVPAPRVSEKPKRSKSPKKKPQTVTGKATAPFAPAKPVATPCLQEFFETPVAKSMAPAGDAKHNSDGHVTIGRSSTAKKTAISKLKPSKAKKASQKQPILLSPESAVKNAINQELIFGTSSQLAREDSPTLIRDVQQAMKESELTVEQKQPNAKDYEFLDLPSGRSRSSNVRATTASKSLWSAASRDVDGTLVEVEIVNLADTPKPIPSTKEHSIVSKMLESVKPQLKAEGSTPSHVGENISIAPKLDVNESANLEQPLQETGLTMPRSVAEAALKTRPKSKSPVKKASAKPVTDQMPNYKGFTDTQLRKEIASYGFKLIKNRDAMISKLEQCWESKRSMALQELPPNVSVPLPVAEDAKAKTLKQAGSPKKKGRPPKDSDQVTATSDKAEKAPPKKPRGRPKKDPTSTTPPKRKRKTKSTLSDAFVTNADDEIYDSSPPTPSPPKRRSPPKSPGQLQLSQPLENSIINKTTTTTKANNNRAHLFSQITKAITTYPPTHDPKNLTWHEKMLMYDPIVLEDLTIWLNTEGLGKVGEDDEVCPAFVKEWCEENSICCLWRENLRGGARGRW